MTIDQVLDILCKQMVIEASMGGSTHLRVTDGSASRLHLICSLQENIIHFGIISCKYYGFK